MNTLSFYLFGNIFILPLFLKDSFAKYSICGWQFFSFNVLNISSQLSWPKKFLLRNLPIILWGILCMWLTVFFSCYLPNSFFVFDFWQFNYNVSWCSPTWVHLCGDFWASWIWAFISFPRLGKFLVIIALNMLSFPFSSSEIPIVPILFPSIVSYKLHILSSLFTFFVFYLLLWLDYFKCSVF